MFENVAYTSATRVALSRSWWRCYVCLCLTQAGACIETACRSPRTNCLICQTSLACSRLHTIMKIQLIPVFLLFYQQSCCILYFNKHPLTMNYGGPRGGGGGGGGGRRRLDDGCSSRSVTMLPNRDSSSNIGRYESTQQTLKPTTGIWACASVRTRSLMILKHGWLWLKHQRESSCLDRSSVKLR